MPINTVRIAPLRSLQCMAAAAAVVALFAGAAHAQAYRGHGPWCTYRFIGPDYDCSYISFEQCWATASGWTNYCTQNPYFVAAPPPVRPVRKSRAYRDR
jgi:hypothetical protein